MPTLPPAVMPQQESSVPQQESPPDAAMAATPEPEPEPEPLLAAEVPAPVQRAADPVPDPPTPCEIAADELPEVGG